MSQGGTGKAEDAKLPGAGIIPKQSVPNGSRRRGVESASHGGYRASKVFAPELRTVATTFNLGILSQGSPNF
jgi:hypothetical protein